MNISITFRGATAGDARGLAMPGAAALIARASTGGHGALRPVGVRKGLPPVSLQTYVATGFRVDDLTPAFAHQGSAPLLSELVMTT